MVFLTGVYKSHLKYLYKVHEAIPTGIYVKKLNMVKSTWSAPTEYIKEMHMNRNLGARC
jgi:hypothetical protein